MTIPNSVTIIGYNAFAFCDSLINVTIGNRVTSISRSAFSYCESLSSVTIPNGVTTIVGYTFFQCKNLSSVTIPNSVTSIGECAFYWVSLSDVYYGGSAKSWANIDIATGNGELTAANIHYGTHGSLPTVPVSNDMYMLLVHDSNGNPLPGATVTWNGDRAQTNAEGSVTFDSFTVDQPRITVTLDGYIPYSNVGTNYQKSARGWEVIKLDLVQAGDYKLTKATCDSSALLSGGIDVLSGTKRLSMSRHNSSFTLTCYAPATGISKYQLWQNKTRLAESVSGTFNIKVGQFSEGGGVFVRVVPSSGNAVDTKLNLSFVDDKPQNATGVKLGGDEVKFTVDDDIPFVGGSEFTVDMPHLPIDLYNSDDTVHLGINLDLDPEDEDAFAKKTAEVKNLFNSLKEVKKYDIGNTMQAKLNYLTKDKNKIAKWGPIDASLYFIGYGEGKFDENGLATVTVNICLLGKAGKTLQGPTVLVGVAPVTYSVKISAEGKLIAEATYDYTTSTMQGDLSMLVTPGLEAFGGVGLVQMVGVGAYGKATLPIDIQLIGTSIAPGPKTIDLTGELGLKAYLGPLVYQKPYAYNTWHLYTRTRGATLSSVDSDWRSAPYSSDFYQLADLDYLANESQWLGTDSMQQFSAISGNNQLTALQTSTYRNMQPVVGAAGDVPVMVWVRANTERGDYDYPQLVYSVYKDGVWSVPAAVDADNTGDAAPALCTDAGGTLWLAYQNGAYALTDAELSDYAAAQSITVAYFDASENCFVDLQTVSPSGTFSRSPRLAALDDGVTVLWAANSDSNDYFGLNSTNSLCYSRREASGWSTATTIAGDLPAIIELDVGMNGSAVAAAAICDTDNNMETTADRTLMLYDGLSGAGSQIATGNVSSLSFGVLPEDTASAPLWTDGAYLYRHGNEQPVLESSELEDGFVLLDDRIVYRAASGDSSSDIFSLLKSAEGWSAPIQLTMQEQYLQSWSVAEVGGKVFIAAAQADVTITEDSVDDDCTLSWVILNPITDIALTAAIVDYSAEAPGASVPIAVDVCNLGDTTINGFSVDVNGVSTPFTDALAPGEYSSVEVAVQLGQTVTLRDYTVTVNADGDENTENNSQDVSIGYCDLSVEVELLQGETSQRLLTKITNNGALASDGTLCISCDGEDVRRLSFDSIAPGDALVNQTELTKQLLGGDISGVLTVSVEASSEDSSIMNDSVQQFASLNIINSVAIKSLNAATATLDVHNKAAGMVLLAVYNDSGRMVRLATQEVAQIDVETVTLNLEMDTLPEGGRARAFLLDENNRPLCAAATENILP